MAINGINVDDINSIIKKTIGAIDSSRNQILQIAENLRSEHEKLNMELDNIRTEIGDVIEEVDKLEKQDKMMRMRLAEVSKNFYVYSESEVKSVYEKTSDIRMKYFAKESEEKALRLRRDRLELDLKKSLINIVSAEKVINQVGIAMGYLDSGILTALEGMDKNSEMFVGIKILEAQENERNRIARDIHDGPAQHMANVVMKVDICNKVILKDIGEGLKELADLRESARAALRGVRNIIFDLRPMSLDDLGLNETLQEVVKTITQETGIKIVLRLKPLKDEIESIIQVAVYRIIQEAFNNIKKHSKAKHVIVKLDFGTQYLMLIISDDGIGFDVNETLNRVKTKGSSYGLIGMFDRVDQLQGEINIESTHGKGTMYKVRLPVNREVIKNER